MSRFDKYKKDGVIQKPDETTSKEEVPRPKVFLVLAGVMMLIALLAYTFESELFAINYSYDGFLITISFTVLCALFFLMCYRIPRIGLKILGRSAELPMAKEKEASVTYNVFKGEDMMEEKRLQSQRKMARHARKRFSKANQDKKEK